MLIFLAGFFPSPEVASPTAVLRAEVLVDAPELRVRDLVETPGFRLPEAVAARIVVRIPRGVDLPAKAVTALVRRRVPGLAVEAPASMSVVRVRLAAGPVGRRATNCFETARPVAAATPLTRQDVVAAPCRSDAGPPALTYDKDGGTHAPARLPAAAYLGPLPPLPVSRVAKGAQLTLRSAAGPVTVERSVTAMQGASGAGRIFVRDEAGKVFSAPLALDAGASPQ